MPDEKEVKQYPVRTCEDPDFDLLYGQPVSVVQENHWSGYGILAGETPNYVILDPIMDPTLTRLWTHHLIEMRTLLQKPVLSITVLDKEHDDGRKPEEDETGQGQASLHIPPPFAAQARTQIEESEKTSAGIDPRFGIPGD